MFDYPLMETLLAVEREGSFEKAAQTQGVTKSAISQNLRLLEERLGAVTVARTSTITTTFGSMLCRHLEYIRLLEQKFLAENDHLFAMERPTPVTVKIALDDDSLSGWFCDVIMSTHGAQNTFYLDTIIADHKKTKAHLESGDVLAAISTDKDPCTGFTSYPLGQHTYRATATPEYVEKYFPKGFSADALMKAPLIIYDETDNHWQLWVEQILGENLSIPTTKIPSSHGIISACLAGSAWGMNASALVDKHIVNGALVELVPDQILSQNLYWHISRYVIDALEPLTQQVRQSARINLAQPQC